MQFVDRLVTKEGWSALNVAMFREHISLGERSTERFVMFQSPNDRSNWGTIYGYKL